MTGGGGSPGGGGGDLTRGILQPETEIKFIKTPQHPLTLENSNQNQATDMFSMQELSFSSMGIGGLDGQFAQIFRRAFASRLFPPE
jgi:vesicle-fusing ATPase